MPDVFGGVVLIDMQIALGLDRQVDPRVARQKIEHVVEKADAGRNLVLALAIEINLHRNLGFLGFAGDFAGTHLKRLLKARVIAAWFGCRHTLPGLPFRMVCRPPTAP
jgi:hypothetical protein